MTSRFGAFNIMLIILVLVTTLAVACGGDADQAASSPMPTASVAESPAPTASPTTAAQASPAATEPATSTAPPDSATSTPIPATTPLPNVPVGESGNAEIYVMNADGSEQRRLTDQPSMDSGPAWSPDGSMVAFLSYGGNSGSLYVMNADGSNMRKLSDAATSQPVWSPDGRQILVVSAHGYEGGYPEIYVVAVDGSGQQRLTSFENVPTATLSMGNVDPAWSPDGTQIAFISMQGDGPSDVHVMNADGTNVRRLTDDQVSKRHPVWSPDGEKIAFTTDFPDPEVWVMNADGSNPLNLSNDPAIDLGPNWSPDGALIAFVRQLDTGNQIVLANADGSDPLVIVDGLPLVERLDWSPDGSQIAFAPFSHTGSLGIFVMNADGSSLQQLTDTANADGEPDWSPDGTQIAFTSTRDGGQPVNCSWSVIGDLAVPGSIEELTWMSHLALVGTVVEELGPAFGGTAHGDGGPDPVIYTDYILEVERQFRGHPLETVRLRTEGGRIGDCVQTYDPSVELSNGMRVLLFLGEQQPDEILPPAYHASVVGTWAVAADDTISSFPMGYNPPGTDGLTIDQVATLVADTLAGPPPPDAFYVVTIEESPATPQ